MFPRLITVSKQEFDVGFKQGCLSRGVYYSAAATAFAVNKIAHRIFNVKQGTLAEPNGYSAAINLTAIGAGVAVAGFAASKLIVTTFTLRKTIELLVLQFVLDQLVNVAISAVRGENQSGPGIVDKTCEIAKNLFLSFGYVALDAMSAADGLDLTRLYQMSGVFEAIDRKMMFVWLTRKIGKSYPDFLARLKAHHEQYVASRIDTLFALRADILFSGMNESDKQAKIDSYELRMQNVEMSNMVYSLFSDEGDTGKNSCLANIDLIMLVIQAVGALWLHGRSPDALPESNFEPTAICEDLD